MNNWNCHTSTRLLVCEESQYDNTIFIEALEKLCGAMNLADQQRFLRYNFVKTKKTHFTWNSIHFLQYFCVSNKEKRNDGKMLTRKQHLPNISCKTLPTIALVLIKTDDA